MASSTTIVGQIKVNATLDSASFNKSLSNMQTTASKAVSNINKSVQSSNATFTGIGRNIQQSISSSISNASRTIRNLPANVSSAVSNIGTTINQLPGTFSRAFSGIANSAKSAFSNIQKSVSELGKKIGDSLKNAAKVGTIAVAGLATAITAQATKAFADYQQNIGGINKLFGDASAQVQANASQAFQSAGISANQYMETVTGFSASLISSLGGNTAEAARLADTAIRDMSDNANTFGTSMDMIMYTYQGFAKQNYTMLDNLRLGYGGTASEMARLINDSGVLGETMQVTAETVNSVGFDKIIEAINVVQQRMNITGTTANEAASTVTGSINSMKASWTDLLTAMGTGEGVETAMDNFMKSIQTVLKNIGPVLSQVLSSIVKAIPALLPQLVQQLTSLFSQLVPQLATMIQQLAQQLPAMIQSLVTAITNPEVIQSVLDAGISLITSLLSVFSNPDMIQQVVNASIQLLMGLIDAIPTIVDAFVAAVPVIIDVLTRPETIGKMLEAAVKLLMAIVESVPKILGALVKAFGNLIGNLWNGIKGLFSSIGQKIGDTVSGAIKGVINGALSLLEGFLNGPINLINGALDLINKLPGVNVGKISPIKLPRMATGGYVDGIGTSTSDSNPVMLSRGEYVVSADTVRRFGVDFFDQLNSGQLRTGNGSTTSVTNNYYQFDQKANNRWMYEQLRTGAAA